MERVANKSQLLCIGGNSKSIYIPEKFIEESGLRDSPVVQRTVIVF